MPLLLAAAEKSNLRKLVCFQGGLKLNGVSKTLMDNSYWHLHDMTIKLLKSQLLQRHCNFQGWECSVIWHVLLNKFKDQNKKNNPRLRVFPHFSSGIVEQAKGEWAWKSPHARKGDTWHVAFSCVGWFSRSFAFRLLYYPWGKMGDYS